MGQKEKCTRGHQKNFRKEEKEKEQERVREHVSKTGCVWETQVTGSAPQEGVIYRARVFTGLGEGTSTPTLGLRCDLSLPKPSLLANSIFNYFDTESWLSSIVEMFLISGKMCSKINTSIWNLLYKCMSDTYIIRLINFPRSHGRAGILKFWTQKVESQVPGHCEDSVGTQKPHDDLMMRPTASPPREMQSVFQSRHRWESRVTCVPLGGGVQWVWWEGWHKAVPIWYLCWFKHLFKKWQYNYPLDPGEHSFN